MSEKNKALQVKTATVSTRFTEMVMREFAGSIGVIKFSEYQKKLTQHLFIKIDAQLKDLEAKRLKDGKRVAPYEWVNINMEKLAVDAVHRIELGLDALIPNHISPIPYWNSKKSKYDLDLRVGYEGKDYYRRKKAIEEPIQIIYELVYSNDDFTVVKQDRHQDVTTYEFNIKQPFDRGEIIGGFGYIVFKDPTKNILVLVSEKEFLQSKNAARSSEFWSKHPEKMRMKTLVHRTTDKLKLDPEKINQSFYVVDNEDYIDAPNMLSTDDQVKVEIDMSANQEYIDIIPDPDHETVSKQYPEPRPNKNHGNTQEQEEPNGGDMTQEEADEIRAREIAEAQDYDQSDDPGF